MSVKKEIFRFLIAGAIINATDFSIYFISFHFLPYSISKGISFTCAGIVGYLLCKYLIFKPPKSSHAEMGRYVLINCLALGINVLTNQAILNVWSGAVLAALLVATALTGLFTFVCFKWWVFRTL
jgi:putative flippase GtrA